MKKMNLVLDKSYLRGAGRKTVCSLCESYNVLMPESLFYEILTTKESKDRAICFGNLPDIDNPVLLIQGIGSILHSEISSKLPVRDIGKMRINVQYNFNKGLSDLNFQFTEEDKQSILQWRNDVASRIEGFKEKCACVSGWFPRIKGYKPGANTRHIEAAKSLLCRDSNVIREIYRAIRHDAFPNPEILTEEWAIYRCLQVHVYAALEYVQKFGDGNSTIISQKIENEMLDLDYCITALLAGALASNDIRLVTKFKRLRPEGIVMSSNKAVRTMVNKLDSPGCRLFGRTGAKRTRPRKNRRNDPGIYIIKLKRPAFGLPTGRIIYIGKGNNVQKG